MGAGAIGGYLGVRLSAVFGDMIGLPSHCEKYNVCTNLDGHTVSPGQGFVVSTNLKTATLIFAC